MNIFPSVLETSPDRTFSFIQQTQHIFTHFQIDIADGLFVDGKTASLEEIQEYLDTQALEINASFEFHLMVQDLTKALPLCKNLCQNLTIQTILVHLEPLLDWNTSFENDNPYVNLLKTFPTFNFGVVLNPTSDITSHLETILPFPLVQIMTIQPGGQGRPFIPQTLKTISILRENGYEGNIQLDGGINDKTLPIILNQPYQPDAVCPGSYLKEEIEDHLQVLKNILASN